MVDTFSVPPGERRKWITVIRGEVYPDYLEQAKIIYGPILARFSQLLNKAETSQDLLRRIAREPGAKMIQLARVFRKYASPDTSVEMLKHRTKVEQIIREFGNSFRPIEEIRARFRPEDDVIAAILYEYKDRGQKGYEITRLFFEWFENAFGSTFTIEGPRGAGR
ncbi:MAG: hypothetical protein V3U90_08470, partial [Dehalococcoidia bacterium]